MVESMVTPKVVQRNSVPRRRPGWVWFLIWTLALFGYHVGQRPNSLQFNAGHQEFFPTAHTHWNGWNCGLFHPAIYDTVL